MTVDTALWTRLLTLSAVTSLVDKDRTGLTVTPRIYTVVFPQDLALWPSVVVKHVDEGRGMHLRGPNGLIRTRVTVESAAKSKTAVDALDAAIDGNGLGPNASGLLGFQGSIGTSQPFWIKVIEPAGKRDDFIGEEFKLFRAMRDYWVDYIP